jgi:hypothetical protein
VPENALGAAVGRVLAVDEDVGQSFKYTLTRPGHVCWAARLTAAAGVAAPYAVPIPLPASGANVTVFFRAQLPPGAPAGSWLRVALRAGGAATSDRYEFTFGEVDGRAAVRRCGPSVCSSPIGGGLVNVPALSSRSMGSYWVTVDRVAGSVALGWAASGDPAASRTVALFAVDPAVAAGTAPVLNVGSVGLSGALVDSRFSSVCFAHPTAAAGARFVLDENTGALATSPSLGIDYEDAQQVYGVEVMVTDQPAVNDLQPYFLREWGVAMVAVSDVNERPTWATIACGGGRYVACLTVPENSVKGTRVGVLPVAVDPDTLAAQTLTYKLQMDNNLAGAAPIFAVDAATGVVTVWQSGVLDFESRAGNTYALVATATDSGSPALSVDAGVFVALTDVCEPPSIADALLKVAENVPRFTVVGTVPGGDPDFNYTAGGWGVLTYSLLPGPGLETNIFAIDAATGVVWVANASVDFERQDSYNLRVQVRDGCGFMASATVAIAVQDVNEAPRIIDSGLRNISEAAFFPASAGSAIYAEDEDRDTKLQWSVIGGSGSAVFGIGACSGVIEIATRSVKLNYERVQSYT